MEKKGKIGENFPREKQSDFWVMRAESRRQVKEDHDGHTMEAGSLFNKLIAALWLRSWRQPGPPPSLCQEEDSSVGKVSKAPAHSFVNQEHVHVGLSVCSQLSFHLEGTKKKTLGACFRQSIFYPKAEKGKSPPLMPSMPGFQKHQEGLNKRM